MGVCANTTGLRRVYAGHSSDGPRETQRADSSNHPGRAGRNEVRTNAKGLRRVYAGHVGDELGLICATDHVNS